MKIARLTMTLRGLALAALLALAGCSNANTGQPAPAAPVSPATIPSAPTQAIASGTAQPKAAAATPVPPSNNNLAARVNGQAITKDQLNQEVARYVASDPDFPKLDTPDGAQMVQGILDNLIEISLIDQEAAKQSVVVSEKDISDEMQALVNMRGGQEQLNEWMKSLSMTDKDIREMIREELVAGALRDKIAASVPQTAEYVHAAHILVNSEAEAKQILAQLQGGAKFETLAKSKSVDPSTSQNGGDLDWFAQGTGSVMWDEVEKAAFQLKPGQLSEVTQSPVGFHIIKTLGRETRPLTAEDLGILQQSAFENWLQAQLNSAKIERFP